MSDHLEEANRIKRRLRACQTREEVETVANEEREKVRAMHEADGEARTMALQIANLKSHILRGFEH